MWIPHLFNKPFLNFFTRIPFYSLFKNTTKPIHISPFNSHCYDYVSRSPLQNHHKKQHRLPHHPLYYIRPLEKPPIQPFSLAKNEVAKSIVHTKHMCERCRQPNPTDQSK